MLYARIAAGLMAAIMGFVMYWALTQPDEPLAESGVKVVTQGGHGSGVHIGKGYVLTAAHVVKNGVKDIKTTDGRIYKVELLWANEAHDTALLYVEAYQQIAASNMTCRTPVTGEDIRAFGNPQNLEFVTTYGKVGGVSRSFAGKAVLTPLSMTLIPGQSGGPVFDTEGNVLGLAMGVMVGKIGMFPSLTGLGYMVPSSDICRLLARE